MGWSIGYDERWKRWIGYGVPAYCDHPGCEAKIDRGLSYVCGGEPYGGERGCGLYFCSAHSASVRKNMSSGKIEYRDHCERCQRGQLPFEPKPDHPDWIEHQRTHESWAEWRAEQQKKKEA